MKPAFLVALLWAATGANAQEISVPSTEIRYDSRNRPVIATQVNNQGPYYMVVDTGAESSLMMPGLAAHLKLESFDTGLTINGATGVMAAKAFPVDRFTSELFDVSYIGLLEVPYAGSTEAAGIIGMDMFADNALVFDYASRAMYVAPSGNVQGKYVTVPAIEDDSLLIRVNVKMNGVDIPALVDTGAAATIANLATLKALGWHIADSHLTDDGTIQGATSDSSKIKKTAINTITLGGITLRDVPVRFTTQADGEAPALILGIDVLNSLLGFAVDLPKQELLIFLPNVNAPS